MQSFLNFKNIIDIIKIIVLVSMILGAVFVYQDISNKLSGTVTSKDLQEQIDAQNRKFEMITDKIARAETKVDDKALKEQIKELDSKLTDKIQESNEKIFQVGRIVATQREIIIKDVGSTRSVKASNNNPNDPNAYEFIKIYQKDINGKEYPVAQAMYYPNRSENERWWIGANSLDYNVKVVQSHQKSGQVNNYAESYIQTEETKDQQFPLGIKEAKFVQEYANAKSQMFVPALDMGVVGNVNGDFGGMANISFFGYGKTEKDLDQKMLSIGIGGNGENYQVQASPAQYNIGNHLPLMTNLYVGPYVTVDKNIKPSGGFGLSVRF